MPKPRIHPKGSRHKATQMLNKANYDKVAANLHLFGFKTMTDLFDHALDNYAKRVNRHQWKQEGANDGSIGSLVGDNQGQ